jgi:hypothetical protein
MKQVGRKGSIWLATDLTLQKEVADETGDL